MTCLRAFFVVLGLTLGCRGGASTQTDGAPPAPAAASSGNLQTLAPIDHKVVGTWTQKDSNIEWRAIAIPKNTTHADLMRLVRTLHAQSPRVFFDIYDDDAELAKLVAAEGNDDVLPKAWREAHAIGTLSGEVKMIDGKATIARFQLVEWHDLVTTPLPD